MPIKAVIAKARVPIKIWSNLSSVESGAIDQLINTANLPFVFKHIAVMPDVHRGVGATIGSVIATKGAISPACVGVDIGCFIGDTLIVMTEGAPRPLNKLIKGGSFLVYACTSDYYVRSTEATALKTRSNAELVEVVLSNTEKIRCTPDQKFMLIDGTYLEAEKLEPSTLVMSVFPGLRVVSVRPLAFREDVFCLKVPGYENFALASGVFVHNCGMAAVKTTLRKEQAMDARLVLRTQIEEAIPVGFEGNKSITETVRNWPGWRNFLNCSNVDSAAQQRATSQLGSLGGGNHFIEVCIDTEDCVWLMLHSGSRNIGKTLAERHINEAKGLMKQLFISLPDPDLAYFAEGTAEFYRYFHDLMWAQEYAFANRLEMLSRLVTVFSKFFNLQMDKLLVGDPVNCHHNYVAREHHFGENVLVTRKGAIRARVGDVGIIPGSMGTKSYIVKGLGNDQSFQSCSHGAGRVMSRGEAKKKFTIEDLAQQTEGVVCRKDLGVLDEIPGAYKQIEEVMENQSDLVEILVELKQVLCVKG